MSKNLGWGMFVLFVLFNFVSVVFTILKLFGYDKYDEALNEKAECVMIEDTAKATEMCNDSMPLPV